MIVPMKRITIITQEKDADASVSALRRSGVLHVEHQQKPEGEDVAGLEDNIALINSAIELLSAKEFHPKDCAPCRDKKTADWLLTAKHVCDLYKRLDQLDEYSKTVLDNISVLEQWGDFDPKDIEELAGKNIFMRFYRIPSKQMHLVPAGAIVKTISAQGGIVSCIIVSREKTEIPFKEAALPNTSLSALRKRFNEDQKVIRRIRAEICELVCYYKDLLRIKKSLETELEFRQAIRGMGKDGSLVYLGGYAPQDKIESVKAQAKKEKWAIVVNEPSEEDDVPVLIRNPRWISLISPIFKFLEILPGYRELDISLPFLVFFSIFFGILIGDAGYGLTYAVITYILHRRAKKKGWDTSPFFLFYVLSFCAVAWGLFTGTFFGQEWFLKTGYQPLIPALNDKKNFQRFCFFLGALHLSIAHAWRVKLKLPSPSALGDVGWGCILWAAFFLARTLILSDPFPGFGKWLIISGILLVIFFAVPHKNILKTIGRGLGALALGLMNSFTDVVSYIRLFAVGLAGVAIADAFNAMAGLVGTGNLLAIAGSVLIIIIGQALGVMLGPVSVLVHGVRLNVLEFSGHANISWRGRPYKPLTLHPLPKGEREGVRGI